MRISTETIEVETRGNGDIIDLSAEIESRLKSGRLREGQVTVFVGGSTAAITTIEFESGVIDDLRKAIERLSPRGIPYAHDARWGDGNGYAHVRAALLGPSLSIPVSEGRMLLGTWQQVVLCDFDNRSRHRKIVVQFMGE
jgi:secondary thiamine-phosphate synthase enzyme